MNRTLILLLVFLLLAGGTAWYLYQDQPQNSTLVVEDRQFAIEDAGQIHKIFLADRQGRNTTLERKGDHWVYNGTYRVRPAAIASLLDAVTRIKMKYIAPKAAEETMIKSLAAEGIKVELYDRAGELIKSYYVGGATADERGTFMIMEGSDQPYVVHIPSWEGNVRFRYTLVGEEWRDRTVFRSRPDDIAAVSIEYPKQRGKSFRLERSGDDYQVEPFYALSTPANTPLRPGAPEAFLTGFERIVAEDFRNFLPQKDSIRQTVPFSIITVERTDGSVNQVKLFPIETDLRQQDLKTGQYTGDVLVERYFADVNGQDFMMMQHQLLEPVLWPYQAFFQ